MELQIRNLSKTYPNGVEARPRCPRCASTSAPSGWRPRCGTCSRGTAQERPPLPTTLDLYRELQAVTPDELQYLLADLFEANVEAGDNLAEVTSGAAP